MKFLVNIVLFIFITFLSTPTIVGLIDNKVDTSYFYSMCEEEENHISFEEIKFVQHDCLYFSKYSIEKITSLNIQIEHDLNFDNLAHQIFFTTSQFHIIHFHFFLKHS